MLTAQTRTDSLMQEVNRAISSSSTYDQIKNKRIDSIKLVLNNSKDISHRALFNLYSQLYNEYQIYNYDSAFSYAQKMVSEGQSMHEDSLVGYAKIKEGFVLLSAGLFKETFDLLQNVNMNLLSKMEKAEYFTMMARYYYDVADYDNDRFYAPRYNDSGNRYIDSSLILFATESFEYIYYNGLKNIRSGNYEMALSGLKKLTESYPMSQHELAVTTSMLSDIYIQKGQTDSATDLLLLAAIEDIRNSTKETRAIFNLATLLFRKGDAKNDSTFREKAVDDAVFYGARQTKVQLTSILPLIEAEKMNILQNENKRIVNYAEI